MLFNLPFTWMKRLWHDVLRNRTLAYSTVSFRFFLDEFGVQWKAIFLEFKVCFRYLLWNHITTRNLDKNPCISEYFYWKIKWISLIKTKCTPIQYTSLWTIYDYTYQHSMLLTYRLHDYKFMWLALTKHTQVLVRDTRYEHNFP